MRPPASPVTRYGTNFGRSPARACAEPKFLQRRRELGNETATRMKVGEEAGRGGFLGDRHAAIGFVALRHQHLETCVCEIAGASEPVMPGADDDDFVGTFSSLNASWWTLTLGGYDPFACDFAVNSAPSVSTMATWSSLSP